jgi:hypothetical protein
MVLDLGIFGELLFDGCSTQLDGLSGGNWDSRVLEGFRLIN